MINVIQSNNLSRYGDLYVDQFRLRYQEFIKRQGYEVKSYKGMEFDQYDTPASVYLVYSDNNRVLGLSRLNPTIIGCMLYEQWPHFLSDPENIISPGTWEGTRFCIDSALSPITRRKIVQELCFAYLEVGLLLGAKNIIGLMHTLVLKSVFGKSGIEYKPIGTINHIGRYQKLQAAMMDVTNEQLEKLKKATGLKSVIVSDDTFYKSKEFKNAA